MPNNMQPLDVETPYAHSKLHELTKRTDTLL